MKRLLALPLLLLALTAHGQGFQYQHNIDPATNTSRSHVFTSSSDGASALALKCFADGMSVMVLHPEIRNYDQAYGTVNVAWTTDTLETVHSTWNIMQALTGSRVRTGERSFVITRLRAAKTVRIGISGQGGKPYYGYTFNLEGIGEAYDLLSKECQP